MFCNSDWIDLVYDDVRYMVHRCWFPCLDYSFNVLISWSHKLSLYLLFCHICFHQILLQIFGFIIVIILYLFTSSLIICVLFHQSPALIILYHAYSLLDVIYYLVTCSCMSMLTTQFSILALLIWIYRYTCAYPCTPLGIHHTTRWGVFDSPGSSCPDPWTWSLWILLVADQSSGVVAWIIGKPSKAIFF